MRRKRRPILLSLGVSVLMLIQCLWFPQISSALESDPVVTFTFDGFEGLKANVESRVSVTAKVENGEAIADVPLRYQVTVTKDGAPVAGAKARYPDVGPDAENPETWSEVTTNDAGQFYFGPAVGFTLKDIPTLTSEAGETTPFMVSLPAGNYSLKVELVDISKPEPAVVGAPGTIDFTVVVDNTPPGSVKNLAAVLKDGKLELSWTNPTDADFHHVNVYIRAHGTSTWIKHGSSQGTSYVIEDLETGKTYDVAVLSVDASGNEQVGGLVIIGNGQNYSNVVSAITLKVSGDRSVYTDDNETYTIRLRNFGIPVQDKLILQVEVEREKGTRRSDVTLRNLDESKKISLTLEDETLVGTFGPKNGITLSSDFDRTFKLRANFDRKGDYTITVRLLKQDTEVDTGVSGSIDIEVDPAPADDKDERSTKDDGKEVGETPQESATPPSPPAPGPTEETTESGTIIAQPNDDGTATLVAQITQQAAASTTGDLTIDLTAATAPVSVGNVVQQVPVASRVVEISTDVLDYLAIQGRNLLINTPEATLVIPPAALPRAHAGSVRISVESIDSTQVLVGDQAVISTSLTHAQEQGMVPAGSVVVLKAEAVTSSGTSAVTTFTQPITLRLAFTQFTNPTHLGVYRLNRSTGEWEYQGGRVNAAGRFVEVDLNGFSEYAVMEYTKSFVDVPFSHWAREDIELMAARHIAKGVSQHLFMPENQITRAEFAALLVRSLRLEPETVMLRNFRDVRPTDWFYSEVATAANLGLVAGSDGAFRPNDPVTRQEMAVMLGRVLVRENIAPQMSIEAARSYIQAYRDADQIADWATVAAAQVGQLGLMKGRTAVTFEPGATATRAEAVVVLKRLLEAIGQL